MQSGIAFLIHGMGLAKDISMPKSYPDWHNNNRANDCKSNLEKESRTVYLSIKDDRVNIVRSATNGIRRYQTMVQSIINSAFNRDKGKRPN